MALTPEQYLKKLDLLKAEIERISKDAPRVKANEILGIFLGRIFNLGKDSNGGQIGTYDDKRKQTFLTNKVRKSLTKRQQVSLKKAEFLSTNTKGDVVGVTYKMLRQLRGLRVDLVDLQFTGELFRSIQAGELSGEVVIGFTNAERRKIAGYLEKKYNKKIFTPSEEEIKQGKEILTNYVKEQLREAIKIIFEQ